MPEQQQVPQPPKKGILSFGKAPIIPEGPNINEIMVDVNSISRRLRLMEEGFTNLRKFMQVNEENMNSRNKHVSVEVKTINSEIMEVRKEVQEIRDKMLLIIRELQTVARKEEVKVLEKYINLWNPIRFVTNNEVEQIISEILEKKSQPAAKEESKSEE